MTSLAFRRWEGRWRDVQGREWLSGPLIALTPFRLSMSWASPQNGGWANVRLRKASVGA